MTGRELLAALQAMDEAALDLPVKVPHHELYDSQAGLETADVVQVEEAGWETTERAITITKAGWS
ncbi:hypothetical protein SEA_WALTZ_49 [Arthrobacter phage Waltz]|nr:hypothetical protein SEA_WALTZ_49 [Arthrobacter phage Waltz]